MKRIDTNKVRTMVEVVETYSKSRAFEKVTIEESNFYYNAFFELVQCIPFTANDRLPAYTLVFTEVKE